MRQVEPVVIETRRRVDDVQKNVRTVQPRPQVLDRTEFPLQGNVLPGHLTGDEEDPHPGRILVREVSGKAGTPEGEERNDLVLLVGQEHPDPFLELTRKTEGEIVGTRSDHIGGMNETLFQPEGELQGATLTEPSKADPWTRNPTVIPPKRRNTSIAKLAEAPAEDSRTGNSRDRTRWGRLLVR
ncbi:hypothetical protein [Nocardiopsis akebiae]|uniref:hypothetical protein n=1 Tax=Nocardiopsis akebiae TaxID=2831968 RepID=UPI0030840C4F